jgi:hypothetical protein
MGGKRAKKLCISKPITTMTEVISKLNDLKRTSHNSTSQEIRDLGYLHPHHWLIARVLPAFTAISKVGTSI